MQITYDIIDRALPPHGVTDRAKYEKICNSMTAEGWVGRPVVVVRYGDTWQALTGSHRIAAAVETDTPIAALTVDYDDYCGDGTDGDGDDIVNIIDALIGARDTEAMLARAQEYNVITATSRRSKDTKKASRPTLFPCVKSASWHSINIEEIDMTTRRHEEDSLCITVVHSHSAAELSERDRIQKEMNEKYAAKRARAEADKDFDSALAGYIKVEGADPIIKALPHIATHSDGRHAMRMSDTEIAVDYPHAGPRLVFRRD